MCFRPPAAGIPVKCPKCGTLNPMGTKVCKECNSKLIKDSK